MGAFFGRYGPLTEQSNDRFWSLFGRAGEPLRHRAGGSGGGLIRRRIDDTVDIAASTGMRGFGRPCGDAGAAALPVHLRRPGSKLLFPGSSADRVKRFSLTHGEPL